MSRRDRARTRSVSPVEAVPAIPARSFRATFLLVLLVLTATLDERSFGLIPDGQQMLSTAVSIVRFGEIGVSRELRTATTRPAGDSVSRYGLALSLLETLPAAVAPAVRRTAALFVLVPALLLALTAGAMARVAALRGLSRRASIALGAAAVLATPLWAYAGTDFSEPLQAALIAVSLLGALSLRGSDGERATCELATGLAIGLLLLTKSLLVLVALPLLALAAFRPQGGVRLRVVASFTFAAAAWAALDVLRFGKLFGGYSEGGFSYPLATGLLRLLVLPNKGLLFYAPLVLLAPLGLVALFRRERGLCLVVVASVGSLLLAVGSWWAWDGEAGWGPRLLTPAIPLLFVAIAEVLRDGRRRLFAALALLGVAVNALGVLEPFVAVEALAAVARPQPISAERARGALREVLRQPDGSLLALGPRHLALTPSWAPWRVHARILRERLRGGDVRARLATALADLDPPFLLEPPEKSAAPAVVEWGGNPLVDLDPVLSWALSPYAFAFWGRSLLSPLPGGVDPYRVALRDQAVRALDRGQFDRALRLAREIVSGGEAGTKDLALAAEASVRLDRLADAEALLARAESCHLWVLFVKAELGKDLGCFPERDRMAFRQSVAQARTRGLSMTAWYRALRGGS